MLHVGLYNDSAGHSSRDKLETVNSLQTNRLLLDASQGSLCQVAQQGLLAVFNRASKSTPTVNTAPWSLRPSTRQLELKQHHEGVQQDLDMT